MSANLALIRLAFLKNLKAVVCEFTVTPAPNRGGAGEAAGCRGEAVMATANVLAVSAPCVHGGC